MKLTIEQKLEKLSKENARLKRKVNRLIAKLKVAEQKILVNKF